MTAGSGWVQRWDGWRQDMKPGDVVWIPPGVKHWHGATATTAVTHVAIQEHENGKVVDWLEKVSDEQYGRGKVKTRSAASTSVAEGVDQHGEGRRGVASARIIEVIA